MWSIVLGGVLVVLGCLLASRGRGSVRNTVLTLISSPTAEQFADRWILTPVAVGLILVGGAYPWVPDLAVLFRGPANPRAAVPERQGLYRASYALVIGLSHYTAGWPSLPGVKDDVDAVRKTLEEQDFSVESVMDLDATQLPQHFERFIATYGAREDNRLLFYVAGHGYSVASSHGGPALGYIVPTDVPPPANERDLPDFERLALSMQRMEEYALKIKAKHVLFLFDSCFSGALFALSDPRPAMAKSIETEASRAVRQFITSGSAGEKVPDKSLFREQFLAALAGAADRNGDGYVTGTELAAFFQAQVPQLSGGAQHPQYGTIRHRYLAQGDFVFAVGAGSASALARRDPPGVAQNIVELFNASSYLHIDEGTTKANINVDRDKLQITMKTRNPRYGHGGACIENAEEVDIAGYTYMIVEIESLYKEPELHVKLEKKRIENPSDTIWLYRDPIRAGRHVLKLPLDTGEKSTLQQVKRLCVAIPAPGFSTETDEHTLRVYRIRFEKTVLATLEAHTPPASPLPPSPPPIELTGREQQHDEDWFIPLALENSNLTDAAGKPGYVLELEVRNLTTKPVQVQLWFKDADYKNVYAYPVTLQPNQQQTIRFNPASDRLNIREFSDFSRIAAVGAKVWGQRATLPGLAAVVTARLMPIGLAPQPGAEKSLGQITRPTAGARVGAEFPAAGTITLHASARAWLAVRKGRLYWPKEPALTQSGPWASTIFEGGPPGMFSLVLIAVDEDTDKKIRAWFYDGLSTGSYPGMPLEGEVRLLAEVQKLVKHP